MIYFTLKGGFGKGPKLTPYPSLAKRGANPYPPSLWEEKVRIAMPRFCEASGDAIPQSGWLGDELKSPGIDFVLCSGHLEIDVWNLFGI